MNNGYTPEPRGKFALIGTVVLVCVATIGAVQFMRPSGMLPTAPLTEMVESITAAPPALSAAPAATAFGLSGGVNVRFALPNQALRFPVDFTGTSDSLRYQWIPFGDSISREPSAPLIGDATVSPAKPGFYQLAVIRGVEKDILPQPTLAVIVPFSQKSAGRLNGYQIGTYIAERMGRTDYDRPEGFIEVRPEMLDLQVTKHLKLSDFVTHDGQGEVWPKYVALNPRLLDKLELVFNDLGSRVRPELSVDVHSGFRTPSYNAQVARAASDSRHQYGDAADIALDADGDGRITMTDELLVMLAVERVEDTHPELVGGLGMYISRRYPTPYLHIDARGKKTRWKG
ncbi:MAG: D-Ala-D-Ala carboxypeptidase family metallohydrolase [bacterium]